MSPFLTMVFLAGVSGTPLPPRADAGSDPVIVAALAGVTFPNVAASLQVRTLSAGTVVRKLDHKVWANGKKLHVRDGTRPLDVYVDVGKKVLVVHDEGQPQAVRFKLAEPAGQRIAGQLLGALVLPPGLTKTGSEKVLGKDCDVYEGEGPSLLAGSAARAKQKRWVWKGMVLRARSEEGPQVIETEITSLELGRAKAKDLDVPRGTKVKDAEELTLPPPPDVGPKQ